MTITPRSLAAIAAALVIVGAVAVMARAADEAVVWIVLGFVLALALDPVIAALGRRGPSRKWAAVTSRDDAGSS